MAVQSTCQLAPGSGRVALDFHSRESNGGAEHFPVGPREWKSGARLPLPGVKGRCRALSSWPPGVEEWRSTFTPGSQMAVQSTFQLAPGSGSVALDFHSRESNGGAEHFPVGSREWKRGAGIHSRESDGSAGSFAVDFREPGSQLRLSLIRCNQY
jgi:hypothetical protein